MYQTEVSDNNYSKILMNIANSYLFVIVTTEKGEEK